MTLYNIIEKLKYIALQQPNIRLAEEGSVYEIMNSNPSIKYNAFVISQQNHRKDEQFAYYTFNLFVIDRLVDDLESNRTQAQSMAIETLTNIIYTLENVYDVDIENNMNFTTFTQKFADECAGAYLQITFQVEKELYCVDGEFYDEEIVEVRNQVKSITLTEGGHYNVTFDKGFTGLKEVKINVDIDTNEIYNSGYTEGYRIGKPEGILEGFAIGKEEGITIGREEAIESLPSLVANENKLYEGAFKDILVDVPQTAKISVKESGIKFGNSTFTTVPDVYDFNGIIDMSYMFADCGNLQTIPPINTSEVTNMSYMFYYSGIKYIPYMDTRKVTTMNRMFSYSGIESLPEFDCSSLTNIERLFQNSGNELTECGGWKNLKINWTDNYGLSRCTNLSYQSCINILNGLYDFTGNGETPNSSQGQLKVSQQFLDLVGDEISIGINKGWTIYP